MPAPSPADAPLRALGLVETLGLVAAIEAADAMLKAADVHVVRQQRTVPGLVTHLVTGETAAVRAAVEAGAAAAARVGRVVATHVIPRPADDVWTRLVGLAAPAARPRSTERMPASGEPASGDLRALTVRELRARVRALGDAAMSGRAVARASKDELLAVLRAASA